MMGQFDNFMKKAAELADKGLKKGAHTFEAGKLKLRISSIERRINDIYERMGRKVYEQCAKEGNPPEYVAEDCAEIYNKLQEIEEIKARLHDLWPASDVEEEEILDDEEEIIVEAFSTEETSNTTTADNDKKTASDEQM